MLQDSRFSALAVVALVGGAFLIATFGISLATLVYIDTGARRIMGGFQSGDFQNMIQDALPMDDIQALLQGFSPQQQQAILNDFVNSPAFRAAIQQSVGQLLASFAMGSSKRSYEIQEKRDITRCIGISDTNICSMTASMCGHLHKCIEQANITECQITGGMAYQFCIGEGF
jgi:hypothetical protein